MIKITIFQNRKKQYTGLSCIGHAGYADAGEDIVCAGVSVLVINTLNAIEAFTGDAFDAETDQESGRITASFHRPAGHDAKLLLDTMVLGLQEIQDRYGTAYSILTFKEV
ncbi:MAG: ribosomal-processing cysteine protease Prp [Eubacterium sp.]|nr:ribosomal-processing cysteine protease Prp [Eubacterium sp.]